MLSKGKKRQRSAAEPAAPQDEPMEEKAAPQDTPAPMDASSGSSASPFLFYAPRATLRQRSMMPVVTPGEAVQAEPGFLRGHGTMLRHDGTLIATVAGVVERVNKLVSVRPMRSRYTGEVGDVVVCRVSEVGQKRWKVDVNSRQHGVLMLSSINLPGGVQRRRTAEDQLNMRQWYVERDLISAEVQAFFQDGSMSLHTRSLKYGKLSGGLLVTVTPALVKRLKQHFHRFDFGAQAIFGMNGFVWVAPARGDASVSDELNDVAVAPDGGDGNSAAGAAPATPAEREIVAKVRNALLVLDAQCVTVSPATVSAVYHAAVAEEVGAGPHGAEPWRAPRAPTPSADAASPLPAQVPAKHMLLPHMLSKLVQPAIDIVAQTASALDAAALGAPR